jgi:transposase
MDVKCRIVIAPRGGIRVRVDTGINNEALLADAGGGQGFGMIRLAPGNQVWMACRPTDMRKSFNGLAAQVTEVLRADPFSGHLFVFRGKRGDHVKILHWDGSGLCLFTKRLENGRFVWPPVIHDWLRLMPSELALLIEGIDWRRTVLTDAHQRPSVA